MDWLFGSSGGLEQASLLTPGQQTLQGQLTSGLDQPMGAGLQWLQQLIGQDPAAMAQFEAPMMRQFEQSTIPMIAERFAGMGSHGAQGSSAQNLAMAQAGRELSENLGALRGQLGMGAMSQLQAMLSQGMSPTFENVYMQPTGGLLGGAAAGGAQGFGQMAGMKAFGL
jgi:hypothetical protein